MADLTSPQRSKIAVLLSDALGVIVSPDTLAFIVDDVQVEISDDRSITLKGLGGEENLSGFSGRGFILDMVDQIAVAISKLQDPDLAEKPKIRARKAVHRGRDFVSKI